MSTETTDNQKEKRLFIETYGCQMNVADSEVVAAIMEMDGYSVTEDEKAADAIFVNTCSIRDNAEQRVIQRFEEKKERRAHHRCFRMYGRTCKRGTDR
jgi:tRNA-2-methylthio-N6-dimethylallyladenosine synthase